MHGPMLHLPDMAELVRDEVVGGIGAAKQDRLDQRVTVIAAQTGEPEEPRRDPNPNAVDPHRPGIQRKRVESCLRALEPRVRNLPWAV